MPDPAKSHRCIPCNVNWPLGSDFRVCPRCQRNTDESWMVPDRSFADARRIKTAWQDWRKYDARLPSKVTTESCRVHCTCILCIKSREIRKALNA